MELYNSLVEARENVTFRNYNHTEDPMTCLVNSHIIEEILQWSNIQEVMFLGTGNII